MLFAGWEVRIVKNCDRGLENAARGRRPRAAIFVTVTAWKKINCIICKHHSCIIINEHPHKDFVYGFSC